MRDAHTAACTGSASGLVSHKMLEEVAGFLNHFAWAYSSIQIFLNGIYATMNSWRPDINEEGWKVGNTKVEYDSATPPVKVKVVLRVAFDISALETLTKIEEPPELFARPTKVAVPRYYFGDASGAGYGMSGWSPRDSHIEVDFGTWCPYAMGGSSSNFRELANIVMKIEQLDADGLITDGTEFFIFTDNLHAESAFYKGTARSPEVLRLMLRLHAIVMKGTAFIEIIWVAGKRMICQGADGLSRSDLTTGVMRGQPMLSYVPLHLSVMERQGKRISGFLEFMTAGEVITALEPQDWFLAPHDTDGSFLWTPPPAIADAAIFQMSESIHIRPWNTHIVILPSLMKGRWEKMLNKAADVVVTLPFSEDLWPRAIEHEPLTLAIIFPLLCSAPWRIKRAPFRAQREGEMRTLQRRDFAFARRYMHELWLQARQLEAMPPGLARSMLHGGAQD